MGADWDTPDGWRGTRWDIVLRAKFTCQRCGKKFNHGHGLTVHHIKPRVDGGDESCENLIALCDPCHNHVEIMGYQNAAMIRGSIGVAEENALAEDFTDDDGQEDLPLWRYNWRVWVYGGMKKPNADAETLGKKHLECAKEFGLQIAGINISAREILHRTYPSSTGNEKGKKCPTPTPRTRSRPA